MPSSSAFSTSGVVEPVFALLTVLVAGTVQLVLPWLLSFAAGQQLSAYGLSAPGAAGAAVFCADGLRGPGLAGQRRYHRLTASTALALGIGIQNFPEGAAISLPLYQEIEEVMEGFPQLTPETRMACGFMGAAIRQDTQAWLRERAESCTFRCN